MENDNNINNTDSSGGSSMSGSSLVMGSDETPDRIDDFDLKDANSLHASGMFYRKYVKEYMDKNIWD